MAHPSGVVFDLGGVVFESPLPRIASFEVGCGLEPQTIAAVIGAEGPGGAWSRFERGESTRREFLTEFEEECRQAGVTVDVASLLAEIESALRPRPAMVDAIDRLRNDGVRVAALTNNWSSMSDLPLAAHFDVFVESVTEGVRKPEPEIYERTLDRLGLGPEETAMLDDLGENLKTARSLGMVTFKVTDEPSALSWLQETFGWIR